MAELTGTSLFSDANLIAYYKAEDTSDSKGSRTLTNDNSVTFTTGKYNNASNFGSSNTNKSLHRAGDAYGFSGGAVTISCWVKLLAEIAAGSWAFVDLSSDTNDNVYQIVYEYNSGTQRIAFNRVKNGVGFDRVRQTQTMGTSNWFHLAITYNTTNIYGYINAVQYGPTAASGDGTGTTANSFTVGADNESVTAGGFTPNLFASALIDDIAIFNRALSSTEITEIYNDQVLQHGVIII